MAIPSDFLGFHHRYVRGRTVGFAHRIPRSALALTTGAAARPRPRARAHGAGPDRLRWPVEQIVGDLNRFLRGWAGDFRYGNSTAQFRHDHPPCGTTPTAVDRGKPSTAVWRYGRQAFHARTDRYRLISPQRNNRRAPTQPAVTPGSRMSAVKNVGEPCEEDPHARIDWGAGGKPTPVGHAARSQAPPAYRP